NVPRGPGPRYDRGHATPRLDARRLAHRLLEPVHAQPGGRGPGGALRPGLDAYLTQNAVAIGSPLASQRGFGVSSGAFFRIDGPHGAAPVVDASSLPADEAASI